MKSFERSRGGFTVVEIAVVSALMLLVAAMAHAFGSGAARSSHATQAASDATCAILLAAEHIGLDLRRAVIAAPGDLAIEAAGRRASFAMATAPYASWNAPFDRVTYALEPGQGPRRLVRTDAAGSRTLHACVLADLVFQERPQAAATPWRATVLVTLVAALNATDRRVVSVEVPVSRGLPPPAYPWMAPGGGR